MKFNLLLLILVSIVSFTSLSQTNQTKNQVKVEGDTVDGEWIRYYENGKIEIKGHYLNGKKHGEWNYFYNSGQLKEQGRYAFNYQSGKWISYFENGDVKEEVNFIEYAVDPDEDSDSFDSFSVVSSKDINKKNDVSKTNLDELNNFDEPASYPGGREAFKKFLMENLKYSKEGRIAGQELKVWLSFVVDLNGEVSQVQVIRGCDTLLDKEAERVIKLTKWNPGKLKGVEIVSITRVPIIFVF
jgi:TonB family protein